MIELNETVPLISKSFDRYQREKAEREKIMQEM